MVAMSEEMSDIRGHKVLKALKFGYEHPEYTEQELCAASGLSKYDFRNFQGSLAAPIGTEDGSPARDEDENLIYQLPYPATINYLEYLELHEARQSSRRAMRIATIAIAISIVVGVMSIFVGVASIVIPLVTSNVATIEETQIADFKRFIESENNRLR